MSKTGDLASNPREIEQYRLLELTCKRAISISSKGRLGSKSYPKVMEALLRLRMFCNNGAAAGLGFRSRPDDILSFLQQSGEAICADCAIDVLSVGGASDVNAGHITPCWRVLCGECSQRHIQERAESSNGEYSCSFCSSMHRTPSGDEEASQITAGASRGKHSSKIQCLVEDVRAHYQGHKWYESNNTPTSTARRAHT
jgi:SWI/SNF-related matrix-associated actin-dependent regulator of chromatin subfamily A3